jgi:hypothetical protein
VTGSGFNVVPEKVREVGQQVVQVSQDVGSIVSSGAATIKLAGSGNSGFLATPAMAALTVAHIAALKNLGGQLQQHGADLGGTAQTYEAVDRDQQNASITAAVPADTSWTSPATSAARPDPTAPGGPTAPGAGPGVQPGGRAV